jgi:hypothetical protein
MKASFYILLALVILASCKEGSLSKTLSIDKMKVMVWDMSCADELFAQLQYKDSSLTKKPQERYKLYNQVFAIHKVSKEKFYTDYKYYQQHTDQFKVLIDSVQAYGLRARELGPKKAPTSRIVY